MRPSRYLKELHHRATRHFHKLAVLVSVASGITWPESDRVMSYVTIESLNTWSTFVRTYFLSCTLSPWTESGSRVTLGNAAVRSFDDAIDAAIRRCTNRTQRSGQWSRDDEPPWRKPSTLIKSCHEIGCSNYANILSAFSIQTRVFDDLPKMRNFYAHRNDHTVLLAKDVAHHYTIRPHGHPTDILRTAAYGRSQALMLDWIDEIRITVELLCK